MVEISELINITTRVSVGGAPRLPFGRGLLLTNTGLGGSGASKVRLFASVDEVRTVFGSGSVTDAATVWFSANPPPQDLWIGRWVDVEINTRLVGSTPAAVGSLAASNGSFTLNGQNVTFDTSGDGSFTAVASRIQSAIQGVSGFSTAVFAYTDNRFVLTLGNSEAITDGHLGDTMSESDTDLADLLGMGPASTPQYLPGSPAESAPAAIGAILGQITSGDPTVVIVAPGTPLTDPQASNGDIRESIAAYAEANDLIFPMLDTGEQVLVSEEATSQAALAFARNQGQVSAVYSIPGQLPDVGLAALMSAQNLDNVQSIITAHGKVLPGVLPTPITSKAALAELERKRVNVYTMVGGQAAVVGGYASRPGYWLDAVWWLAWFRNRIRTAVWNAQRRSRRFSRAMLAYELSQVAEAAVQNGGLEPGRKVNSALQAEIIASTGNQRFNGVLSAGYLVWVDPMPSQADRDARIARFKLWGTGGDAVHKVFGDLVFQN